MKIRVLYFARLRERLGVAEEELELAVGTVTSLLELLRSRGGIWQQELSSARNYRIAINLILTDTHATINPNDEIAIFPPVTGG